MFSYFKSKAKLEREIRRLDALVVLASNEVVRIGDECAKAEQQLVDVMTENAHLRRVVGGYKSGETRRAKKGE